MARVAFRPKAAWAARSSFILGVSMGSQNHEGEALKAIVNVINEGRFTSGLIDVSDTLNRYRYLQQGFSEEAAITKTRQEGKAWIERNGKILSELRLPVSVRRWDEWLSAPDYVAMRSLFGKLYEQNVVLRGAVEKDIAHFFARQGVSDISESSRVLSRRFYLEELAVQSLIFRKYPGTALYPGKQLECFKVVREGRVPGAPASLVSSPYVRLVVHSFEQSLAVNENRVQPADLLPRKTGTPAFQLPQ